MEMASGYVGEGVTVTSWIWEDWDLGHISIGLCFVLSLSWPLWGQPISLGIQPGAVEHLRSGGDSHSVLGLGNLSYTYSLFTGGEDEKMIMDVNSEVEKNNRVLQTYTQEED